MTSSLVLCQFPTIFNSRDFLRLRWWLLPSYSLLPPNVSLLQVLVQSREADFKQMQVSVASALRVRAQILGRITAVKNSRLRLD